MREIKFRGRREFSDEYVYGSYYYENHPDFGEIHSIVDDYGRRTSVDPETVAQLIGHDTNGAEIYEGDKLTDKVGNEYTAVLEPCVDWKNDRTDSIFRRVPIEFAKKVTKLTLVEAAS